MLVPRLLSLDTHISGAESCNCYELQRSKMVTQQANNILNKLERLLLGSSSVVRRLLGRQSSLESSDENSSTDSSQTNEPSDKDMIMVPCEFKVREFPASSLFSASSSSTPSHDDLRGHSRECTSHRALTSPAHSRHDRFYHVFKKGEIERLVRHNAPDLHVVECVYESGHWCATLRKTSK